MNVKLTDPPRIFRVGQNQDIEIKDCARIELEPNEQVTFTTQLDAEYDVARKSWGFYATPSLNGRLQQFNLRGVLGKNSTGKYYIFLVERGKETEFQRYLEEEKNEIVCWLDSDSSLASLETNLKEK